ncbi:hypothetical protein C942_00956 [Photobacterium marinum]|uniref:Uncharacterized protein n=1 Tax=Photobacterium marinum TaxID=1056511 RepID=L8JEC1_9GAMM|nr:hypothetical protein [Photobacterium marinum]ELR65869.1 hypothetical protein C942_00956 [Photobacterium marinum]
MAITYEFNTDASGSDALVLKVKNTGPEVSLKLGGANSFETEIPGGTSVIAPPEGKYWHVDMNTAKGGVSLGGTHGPVIMPANSSVEWYLSDV